MHSDICPLLRSLLDEQRKTNSLLLALVEAMADERDPDAEPQTYLNGEPIPQEPPHVEFVRKR
ncbi:hypothetical protein DK254_00265 [Pseudomonas sp. RW407]|nr:hypothetical protein DK254_11685 [Pseudomonas sp. RW407]PWU32192.1 hypothetical protein DK254_00265 [Pseudomonas sp. RW407]